MMEQVFELKYDAKPMLSTALLPPKGPLPNYMILNYSWSRSHDTQQQLEHLRAQEQSASCI